MTHVPAPRLAELHVILGSPPVASPACSSSPWRSIAGVSIKPEEVQSGQTFSTPTIVHFVAVLLLSASMVMPWYSLTHPAIL